MLARPGLVGKKSSRPHLGPSEAIFSMDRKNPKNAKILSIFLVVCDFRSPKLVSSPAMHTSGGSAHGLGSFRLAALMTFSQWPAVAVVVAPVVVVDGDFCCCAFCRPADMHFLG